MEGLHESAVSQYHKGLLDSGTVKPLGLMLHVSHLEEEMEEDSSGSDGDWGEGDDGSGEGGDRGSGEPDERKGEEGDDGTGRYSFSRELITFSLYGKIPTKSSEPATVQYRYICM